MSDLIQVIYISRSTFESKGSQTEIDPNVARILIKSRSNNRKNGLVGVLYFGDGCFFQCLEGTEDAVFTLMAKLSTDPRHKDIKIISQKKIDSLTFAEWSMKYVPLEADIKLLLVANKMNKFDPYLFTPEMTHGVLDILYGSNQQPMAILSEMITEQSPISVELAGTRKLAKAALIVALFALVFAVVALVRSA